MKITIAAALVGAASTNGVPSSFPKEDYFHAHCNMQVSLAGNCDTAYLAISNILSNFETQFT